MTQMIVRSVLNKMDSRNRQQPQLKDYDKTTVFKARGGAWFTIVLSCLIIAMMLYWLIFSDPDFWLYVLCLFCIVIFIFILRKSISMLKAQIIVGPENCLEIIEETGVSFTSYQWTPEDWKEATWWWRYRGTASPFWQPIFPHW